MSKSVLLDTGALVAVCNRSDVHHEDCIKTLKTIYKPLTTTWPVLTEVFYLLRRNVKAQSLIMALIQDGSVRISELDPSFLGWFERFATSYSDREVDLADGSLVYTAERLQMNRIFTVDRKDFTVYRVFGEHSFDIVP